jgi:hypothetical protein
MKALSALALALLMAVLAGCGGSGGGGGGGPTVLLSVAGIDGTVTSDGVTTTDSSAAVIGDDSGDHGTRLFLSFDISGIPSGATIESATLRIYQNDQNTDGYSLGSVLVDHMGFGFLSSGCYDVLPFSTVSGSLATSYSEGWKEIVVTTEVQYDVDQHRSASEYRIYHQTAVSADGVEDSDGWLTGDSSTNKPQLVINYH